MPPDKPLPPRPVGASAAAAVCGGGRAAGCGATAARRPAGTGVLTGSYSTILRSLFGVPSVALLMASGVAPSVSAVATASGVASWWPAR